jgi:ubiquinone/menaquinone biosynthesis C-methylase UbiE
MSRTLSHEEAKAFYDRLGRRQDWQAFFEDRAVEDMVVHDHFDRARAICEFGCGTGRLAQRLLQEFLPSDSTYVGLDISETMVALARSRLSPWKARARVVQTDGTPHVPLGDASVDRFLACYVLDLLSEPDIRNLLSEAHRVLVSGGLICLVSLTYGNTTASKILISLWERMHAWRPWLVGGCRPLELCAHLSEATWQLQHRSVITRLGMSSEVVVASRAS